MFPVQMVAPIMIGLVYQLLQERLLQFNLFCQQALASVNCLLASSRHSSGCLLQGINKQRLVHQLQVLLEEVLSCWVWGAQPDGFEGELQLLCKINVSVQSEPRHLRNNFVVGTINLYYYFGVYLSSGLR